MRAPARRHDKPGTLTRCRCAAERSGPEGLWANPAPVDYWGVRGLSPGSMIPNSLVTGWCNAYLSVGKARVRPTERTRRRCNSAPLWGGGGFNAIVHFLRAGIGNGAAPKACEPILRL